MTPRNEENPYLPHLRASLGDLGVDTGWWEMSRTSSQTVNTLISPFELWRLRRCGGEILHIHWIYNFAWPWSRRIPVVRSFPRHWMNFVLTLVRLIGFRIVFTWHDTVPLNQVFDDDHASRTAMIKRLDAIITITPAARDHLVNTWGVQPDLITVIPEGAPSVRRTGARDQLRQHLGVNQEPLIVAYGHIDPYKGLDLLLAALSDVPDDVSFAIRILGEARDPEYRSSLQSLLDALIKTGRNARWDVQRFSDEQLSELLVAADLVALPFKWITNSATMRMAMAYERATLLPALEALADIPREAAYYFDPRDPDDLIAVLTTTLRHWPADSAARAAAAQQWVTQWSWSDVARATRDVYDTVKRVPKLKK